MLNPIIVLVLVPMIGAKPDYLEGISVDNKYAIGNTALKTFITRFSEDSVNGRRFSADETYDNNGIMTSVLKTFEFKDSKGKHAYFLYNNDPCVLNKASGNIRFMTDYICTGTLYGNITIQAGGNLINLDHRASTNQYTTYEYCTKDSVPVLSYYVASTGLTETVYKDVSTTINDTTVFDVPSKCPPYSGN